MVTINIKKRWQTNLDDQLDFDNLDHLIDFLAKSNCIPCIKEIKEEELTKEQQTKLKQTDQNIKEGKNIINI